MISLLLWYVIGKCQITRASANYLSYTCHCINLFTAPSVFSYVCPLIFCQNWKKSQVLFLTRMDLSTAFDTVDHDILLLFLKLEHPPLDVFVYYVTGLHTVYINIKCNVRISSLPVWCPTLFCYGTTEILYLYTSN